MAEVDRIHLVGVGVGIEKKPGGSLDMKKCTFATI